MPRSLVYITGAPGSGKSSLMAALTARCDVLERPGTVPHCVLVDPRSGELVGAELGVRRPNFPGTDTLSMSIGPKACRWMGEHHYDLVLGEGDRLSYAAFLNAAKTAGHSVTLVYTECKQEVLDRRCKSRGSKQNESWRRGRATKAQRLQEQARSDGHTVVYVDTSLRPPDMLAYELRAELEPLWRLP